MTKLSDLQSLLLATAASRDSGSLMPLRSTIKAPAGGVAKSLTSLVNKGLAEERAVIDATMLHRTDGEDRYGLFITAAGEQAIGIVDDDAHRVRAVDLAPPPIGGQERGSKAKAVLALLQRAEGATIADLTAATGWLPHTTRAALTGLRKKGRALEKGKRDGVTCYRIVGGA